MNIVGQKVLHKQFGEGIIKAQDDHTIRIFFSEELGEKVFLYPDSFERYLTTESPKLYERISDEITARHIKAHQEREAKRKLEEQRLEEQRIKDMEFVKQRRKTTKATAAKVPKGKAS